MRKTGFWDWIISLTTFFVCALSAVAQGGLEQYYEAGLPYIRYFSPKEYGYMPKNWSIIQDNRGVIYVSNEGHMILEYDGVAWRSLAAGNADVYSLACDTKGRLYYGGVGQFGLLEPNTLGNLKEGVPLSSVLLEEFPEEIKNFREVWSTYFFQGGVFFQTDKVLFYLKESSSKKKDFFTNTNTSSSSLDKIKAKAKVQWELKYFKPLSQFYLSYLVGDRFFIHDKYIGLFEFYNDQLNLVPGSEIFADLQVATMLPFDAYRILIGTREKGFFIWDGNSFLPFRTAADNYLLENSLYHGTVLREGGFAFATLFGGVVIINKEGFVKQFINKSVGLPVNQVHCTFEDKEGGLWIALSNGIARVELPSMLSRFNNHWMECTPFEIEGCRDIVRHKGKLFAATTQGIFVFHSTLIAKNNSPTVFIKPRFEFIGQNKIECWDLLSTHSSILAATKNGVFIVQEKGIEEQPIIESYARKLFRSEKDTNLVYVATNSGELFLLQYERGIWKNLGLVSIFESVIEVMTEDVQGRLWVSTKSHGLARITLNLKKLQSSAIEYFTVEHGLDDNNGNVVTRIGKDIFISNTVLYGILIFDEAKYQAFLRDKKTRPIYKTNFFGSIFGAGSDYVIFKIHVDHENRVWFFSTDGKDSKFKIHLAIKKENGSYYVRELLYNNFIDFLTEAFLVEKDGTIWFGGLPGIVRLNSPTPFLRKTTFPALLRGIMLIVNSARRSEITKDKYYPFEDNSSYIFKGYMTENYKPIPIKYEDRSIKIEYALPSFDRKDANEYQVWLERPRSIFHIIYSFFEKWFVTTYYLPSEWSAWEPVAFKEYDNLDPGEYTFHVKARNVYQNISSEATFTFEVLPPWYRTWWATTLWLILSALGVYGIVRWRTQRLEKEKQILELKVDERTRELNLTLEDLKKTNEKLEAANNEIQEKNIALQKQNEELEQKNRQIEIQIEEISKQNAVILEQSAIIVESEKKNVMAEFTSIVAHEVNTPLSAFQGTIRNVRNAIEYLIQQQIQNLHVNGAEKQLLLELLENAQRSSIKFSTAEERKLRRQYEKVLEEAGLEQAEEIAQMLIRNKFVGDIIPLIPVFRVLGTEAIHFIDFAGNLWRNINTLDNSSAKALKIVSILREIVKPDTDKPIEVNIVETIRHILTLYEYYLVQGITVETHFEDSLTILGYPQELMQLWSNIIMADIKAMNNQGVLIINACKAEGGIKVEFVDNGPQIPEEVLKRIFMVDTIARRAQDNTGKSLASCKNIVEKHNGKIEVTSSPEQTKVFVWLPFDPEAV
ncbi:MAG: ATP-binding protein [Bacteroidia bacterium]|nr:ATP-binding protein [Bacteroidia bacterium]MDW8159168.1 ATP-binding protein [Bacteroidia bacterium]